jgi:endonuclease YncB( thermonuclease family)
MNNVFKVGFFLFLSSLQLSATDIDGNTIEIQTEDNFKQRVVLAGIDCPELTQEFGEDAKRYVEKLVLQKNVTVKVEGKDRKGNYVGVVMIGDKDIRERLLKEGLAWTSEIDSDQSLESFKALAQKKSKGLWKSSNPTPPWVYRREQSMLEPKSSS